MPNISLTFRCNLRCPYCFAHGLMDASPEDITLENFDKAVEFLTREAPVHVGLIGGEPTLHPQFGEMLRRTIDNPRITSATVFTNGILLGRYLDLVAHPKVSLLVNWNSPEMLGDAVFQAIQDNADALVFEHHMERRLNLGFNLSDTSMDYGYLMDILRRYGLHKVRLSITVPSFPAGCRDDVLAYFRSYKAFLMAFFHDMDSIGVLPYYDCNRPPYCIWTDEEKRWLEGYVGKYKEPENPLANTKSFCRPVIDILPDLRAVRCFGMSFFEKASIADFSSLEELTAHFMRLIDARAYKIPASGECGDCHLRRTWLCCQGCMGFKAESIGRMVADAP